MLAHDHRLGQAGLDADIGNNPCQQIFFLIARKKVPQFWTRINQSQHSEYCQVRSQCRPRHVELRGDMLARNRALILYDIQNSFLAFR